MVAVPQAIDTYTSAPWFDGFRETIVVRGLEAVVRRSPTRTRGCLTIGWRRHGLLSAAEPSGDQVADRLRPFGADQPLVEARVEVASRFGSSPSWCRIVACRCLTWNGLSTAR
jgi:hypothetical protein